MADTHRAEGCGEGGGGAARAPAALRSGRGSQDRRLSARRRGGAVRARACARARTVGSAAQQQQQQQQRQYQQVPSGGGDAVAAPAMDEHEYGGEGDGAWGSDSEGSESDAEERLFDEWDAAGENGCVRAFASPSAEGAWRDGQKRETDREAEMARAGQFSRALLALTHPSRAGIAWVHARAPSAARRPSASCPPRMPMQRQRG